MHGPSNKEILRQLEQIVAKINAIQARAHQKERKDDTRRKIIAGALALQHMEKNPNSDFAKTLARLLNEYVTKPGERPLFALPPMPEVLLGEPPTVPVLRARGRTANDAKIAGVIHLKEHFRKR